GARRLPDEGRGAPHRRAHGDDGAARPGEAGRDSGARARGAPSPRRGVRRLEGADVRGRPRVRDAPPARGGPAGAEAADPLRRVAARVDRADAGRARAGVPRRACVRHAARREVGRRRRAAPPRADDVRGRGRGPDVGARDRPGPRRGARAVSDAALAEVLEEVRRIDVLYGWLLTDLMAGAYTSVFRGSGIEFDRVREYAEGDDPRTVDWNVTARVGRPFVRTYVDERE